MQALTEFISSLPQFFLGGCKRSILDDRCTREKFFPGFGQPGPDSPKDDEKQDPGSKSEPKRSKIQVDFRQEFQHEGPGGL